MLVCWDWLSQYVDLDVQVDDLADRFAMSGLNHEGTEIVGSDTVLDLEVTSNRGDCLGHIGVAREAAVLLGNSLRVPSAEPPESGEPARSYITVDNQFKTACPLYTARIIKGVKVGPSPEWLVRRLAAIGIASVNNVVDATNYVMMECGQPLHAFDLERIRDKQIIIRPAAQDEEFIAIDHKTYKLDSSMVVIADAERAVAIGGVMGGAESEVAPETVDLLVEAATFQPLSIRRAARTLKLHSPSSYRFERRPDPKGLQWASERCCDLILQLAGGTLLSGVVADGDEPSDTQPIAFRYSQISRVLGIAVPSDEVCRILEQLGCNVSRTDSNSLLAQPPSWRTDLTREIDLIEEVARIHGYEKIPEDVPVPMTIAPKRDKDIAMQRVRHVLSAYGIDEAMTPSVVGQDADALGSLWTNNPALSIETPLLDGARQLRRSIITSLLAARYTNQKISLRNAQLYELSTLFVPNELPSGLPAEQSTLAIVAGGDLRFLRGVVEEVVTQVAGRAANSQWAPAENAYFEPASLLELSLNGSRLAYVGLVSKHVRDNLSLEHTVSAAEINMDVLTSHLEKVRRADPVSAYPAISRDLNFIVDESLRWDELSALCESKGSELLTDVIYQETYRDAKKDGKGKKRLLMSLRFQSLERTLTSEEVDRIVAQIVTACQDAFQAQLLG